MSTESYVLLPQTTIVGDFTGEKAAGAGYHRKADNLHTFTAAFANWSGELRLQGTLKLYPNDTSDWFDLKNANDDVIVIGDGSTDYDQPLSVNSAGNFVWVRAAGTTTSGEITEIRYNY